MNAKLNGMVGRRVNGLVKVLTMISSIWKNNNMQRRNLKQDAASTDESDSSPRPRHDKEKSQLCKKFMEFGVCPYQDKCKFAHGSHELRKNKQFNTKYKTKVCGVFLNGGCCMFGDRCNFIHVKTCLRHAPLPRDNQFLTIRNQMQTLSQLLPHLQ